MSFPLGNRQSKAWGLWEGQAAEGVSLRQSGGSWVVFARLVSTALKIKSEFYLASARSALSEDNVWEPRVILIPCWYTVSVIHTAVENPSSSCYAALLMLMGLEHWSSWLSQRREVWFCCSFFSLFQKCICWETTNRLSFITSRCLRWNLSWYPICYQYLGSHTLSKTWSLEAFWLYPVRAEGILQDALTIVTAGTENTKHCLAKTANASNRRGEGKTILQTQIAWNRQGGKTFHPAYAY